MTTIPVYVESSRSIVCNVVTVVTTHIILQNGTLRNVPQKPILHKGRRIVPPSPIYGEGAEFMPSDILHERMLRERQEFMTRLFQKRADYCQKTHSGVVKIQSAFRRYMALQQLSSRKEAVLIRRNLCALLQNKHHRDVVTSRRRFLNKIKFRRHRAAMVIQQALRIRKDSPFLRDESTRMQSLLSNMATRIQCLRRRSVAKQRLSSMAMDKYFGKKMQLTRLRK